MSKEILAMLVAVLTVFYILVGIATTVVEGHVDKHLATHHPTSLETSHDDY